MPTLTKLQHFSVLLPILVIYGETANLRNDEVSQSLQIVQCKLQKHVQDTHRKGPFTLAIFAAILAAIFAAISNRPCKLLAIQIAVESPVVYTGDLKSPSNRHEIAAKIASVNGP